jgi:Flp pilus assembly protein TadG
VHEDGTTTIVHREGYMHDAGTVADIVRAAARLTTPGLAEKTTRAVASYLVDQVASRYADASLVVLG